MRKILFVDDDKDLRQLIQAALTSLGYSVLCAASGQEALEDLEQQDFDLVITDLSMPTMDGLELCKTIKDINADLKVCVLTGRADLVTALKAIENGADNYLIKPMDGDQLHTMICNTLPPDSDPFQYSLPFMFEEPIFV